MPEECSRISQNMDECTCSYEPCPRKGNCCECIMYHKSKNEVPGCLFPPEAEKTYDRSIDNFISTMA